MDDQSKSLRPSSEIQAEYTNLCTKAGNLHFSIENAKKDIALVTQRASELFLEYTASVNAEAAAAKQSADQPKQEVEVKETK